MNLLNDLIFFLFPHLCEVCGRLLYREEKIMCSYCDLDLPRTNFQYDPENAVAKLFWGRVMIMEATAWFFFNKGSNYQVLLHNLKYRGRGDIGIYLGQCFGGELIDTVFAGADMIIPVPLHKKKEKKRGYNQSLKIAIGMKKSLGIPINTDSLIRTGFSETQTRKNRYDRFLNMQNRFEVVDWKKLEGKKILLVDDVVTTGSTLEACALNLIDAGCEGVMVATLAVA